jgi:hypothetical protein
MIQNTRFTEDLVEMKQISKKQLAIFGTLRAGFEPARVSPKDFKSFSLTARTSQQWCKSQIVVYYTPGLVLGPKRWSIM